MDKQEKVLRSTIAANIRALRARKNITQEYLAELANLTQNYIYQIENELSNPSIYTMYKIARALDVTIDKLVY